MKKHWSIGLILGLSLFPAVVFPQTGEELVEAVARDDLGNASDVFQEHFFEALKQKAIENPERAIEALEECLKIDSSQYVVHLELGKNHNSLENFTEAAGYLETARDAEPGNSAILAELYSTYYMSKEFGKALPVVKELAALKESYSEELANVYMLNERYQEALDVLDELDEKWGKSDYRNGLRQQVYARTDDTAAKIADLEGRIEKDPEEEQNYLNLIYVYSEAGNSEKAFETAKQLQEANPSSELVHLALYKFHLEEGETQKAKESMKILLMGRELDEETKYQVLNDFLLFVETQPGMEKDLVEVVEVFSEEESNTMVYEQLGIFYQEKGELEKALEYYERGLEAKEDNFGLMIKALLLQLEFKKFQRAVELSGSGLERFPSQPVLYLLNGTALNYLTEYGQAEEILLTGLDYLVEDAQMEAAFYEQLSVAYTGLEHQEQAEEYENKAAQLKSDTIDE